MQSKMTLVMRSTSLILYQHFSILKRQHFHQEPVLVRLQNLISQHLRRPVVVNPNQLAQIRYSTNSIIRYKGFSTASGTTGQFSFCYQQCDVADSDIHRVRDY
jgi:hypothetical protein